VLPHAAAFSASAAAPLNGVQLPGPKTDAAAHQAQRVRPCGHLTPITAYMLRHGSAGSCRVFSV
jgi:hypothetical protein